MSELLISEEDSILFLTLNRPDKRNALNDSLIGHLQAALSSVDETIAAVVIRGAGKDFCSGADLSSLQKIANATYEENLEDAAQLADLFDLIRNLPVPVIAAVHGRALAGGCGLATACDLVVATESARFGYPEVKIGFVPAIVTAILRRNVSEKQAFELITRGFEFDSATANQLGLVNQICGDEQLEEFISDYAGAYRKLSRSAVSMSKSLLYEMDSQNFASSMEMGIETNARARMTEDCKKGIANFLNKKP
jgi:methylglutaconyl-CoA hydratase